MIQRFQSHNHNVTMYSLGKNPKGLTVRTYQGIPNYPK